jgi:hypothetical protein
MKGHFCTVGLAWTALLASAGCAAPYAYRFDMVDPGARYTGRSGARDSVEDADVGATVLLDPAAAAAVQLEVTNKSAEVLQIDWARITLRHADGTVSSLRPDGDLGWILPGRKQTAWLSPFVLPRDGPAAAAYEGQVLDLIVPMTVRREAKVYHYHFVVHAQPLGGA